MFYRLITLIRKEIQALIRNPQSRAILFMPVLIQLLIFPFAGTLEVKNATIAIYNQDNGPYGVELIQRLIANQAFPHQLVVHSQTEMTQAIDRQQALIGVIIFPDFSRQIQQGKEASIQGIIDGRKSNSAQIAIGYTQQILNQFAKEKAGQTLPVELMVRNEYNPNLDYQWFILPSLVGIITSIGSLVITALSIAREKEEGTFEQLLVSPLTPAYIMAGKAVPAILVGLIQGAIITLAAVFIYGVPFLGSPFLLAFAMLCYSLSLVGFGLFISSLCANQQQAFLGAFSFLTPSVVLSGYMGPIENMPTALQIISLANPLRHMIVTVKGVFLKGYTLPLAWPYLWPMLVIALISTLMATLLFYRKTT